MDYRIGNLEKKALVFYFIVVPLKLCRFPGGFSVLGNGYLLKSAYKFSFGNEAKWVSTTYNNPVGSFVCEITDKYQV